MELTVVIRSAGSDGGIGKGFSKEVNLSEGRNRSTPHSSIVRSVLSLSFFIADRKMKNEKKFIVHHDSVRSVDRHWTRWDFISEVIPLSGLCINVLETPNENHSRKHRYVDIMFE